MVYVGDKSIEVLAEDFEFFFKYPLQKKFRFTTKDKELIYTQLLQKFYKRKKFKKIQLNNIKNLYELILKNTKYDSKTADKVKYIVKLIHDELKRDNKIDGIGFLYIKYGNNIIRLVSTYSNINKKNIYIGSIILRNELKFNEDLDHLIDFEEKKNNDEFSNMIGPITEFKIDTNRKFKILDSALNGGNMPPKLKKFKISLLNNAKISKKTFIVPCFDHTDGNNSNFRYLLFFSPTDSYLKIHPVLFDADFPDKYRVHKYFDRILGIKKISLKLYCICLYWLLYYKKLDIEPIDHLILLLEMQESTFCIINNNLLKILLMIKGLDDFKDLDRLKVSLFLYNLKKENTITILVKEDNSFIILKKIKLGDTSLCILFRTKDNTYNFFKLKYTDFICLENFTKKALGVPFCREFAVALSALPITIIYPNEFNNFYKCIAQHNNFNLFS